MKNNPFEFLAASPEFAASPSPQTALTRRGLMGAALAGSAVAPLALSSAWAQESPFYEPPIVLPEVYVPGSETLDSIALKAELSGRITAEVMLNGQGPFRFFVDTGANRCALSAATAVKIGAVPAGDELVHGISGAKISPMATVSSLKCGVFELKDTKVPILGDDLMGGADGMLGMDRFKGLRLEFDNTTKKMIVKRSGRGWSDAISVPANIRFGQLVSVKGRIGDLTVPIIFDTGAEYGLANNALRNRIQARRTSYIAPTRLANAAEPIFVEDAMMVPLINLPNATLRNVDAFIGDFHIFKLWGMIEEPALIAGMRVLRSVSKFAIDYNRREMQFLMT